MGPGEVDQQAPVDLGPETGGRKQRQGGDASRIGQSHGHADPGPHGMPHEMHAVEAGG